MLNRVVLVGRLTKDPDLKVSQNKISVATFTLAVNRPFTSSNGACGADFLHCVVFCQPAENANQYEKKGRLAGVDGRLQSRTYDNKDGQRVFVTEVVCDSVQFLEPNGQGGNQQQQYNNNSADSYTSAYGNQSTGSRPA